MALDTPPELETLRALSAALEPRFRISVKVRALDYLRATAAAPRLSDPVGPTLGTWLLPAMREAAGPFDRNHPWLREGDFDYAFKAHFDFIVQASADSEHPSHPLFAVEFDGRSHEHPDTQRRDRRKNRLCAAAGLPLVRIDDGLLARREQITVVRWLAETWIAYRDEMPALMAERDAEVARMSEEEFEAAGQFLLLERPDLDVEMIFREEHPFPALAIACRRLATRYGFRWPHLDPEPPDDARWRVASWMPPYPSLGDPLVETWRCSLTIAGPDGSKHTVEGRANVRTGYELHDEPLVDQGWPQMLAGNLPYLPAGPWHTAPSLLGEALCLHNALVNTEHFLKRRSAR